MELGASGIRVERYLGAVILSSGQGQLAKEGGDFSFIEFLPFLTRSLTSSIYFISLASLLLFHYFLPSFHGFRGYSKPDW